MSYCWKCEEIKEQHKLLNKMLPDDVVELVSDYDKCDLCTCHINLNKRFLRDVKKNDNDAFYGIRRKITRIIEKSEGEDYYCNSMQDLKNIIKRSNHPLMKEMMRLLYYKNKKLKVGNSNLISFYLYKLQKCCNRIFDEDFWTEKEKEILREISLILIEFYNTCNKHRINITTTEIRDYLIQI